MINTYHNNLPPPPVPPRLGSKGPATDGNTPLVKFLSGVMVFLILLTFSGFVFLFERSNKWQGEFQIRYRDDIIILKRLQECEAHSLDDQSLLDCKLLVDKFRIVLAKVSQTDGRAAMLSGGAPFHGPVARMAAEAPAARSGGQEMALHWNRDHSLLEHVDFISPDTLTIKHPGQYYIYSQVTFSKRHFKAPLRQSIVSQRTGKEKEILLKAFCSLNTSQKATDLCTSFQGGVFELDKGQQLFVNVTDIGLVNFDSTIFGLFKL